MELLDIYVQYILETEMNLWKQWPRISTRICKVMALGLKKGYTTQTNIPQENQDQMMQQAVKSASLQEYICKLKQHQGGVYFCAQQHHFAVGCEDKWSGVQCLCQKDIKEAKDARYIVFLIIGK